MDKTGYYALVRYIPDIEMEEFVNIGVVLFETNNDDDKLSYMITHDLKRVKRFFDSRKDYDEERIEMSIMAFGDRLDTENINNLESLRHFVETRTGVIQFGHLRGIRIENANKILWDLYNKNVKGKGIEI